ncbi:MAG: zinc ribbon domain-containing protein, partial [Ruminococcus sp.]|nr:zinc ribbon domain-containing protein [Ruminococcus sp.]
GINYTEWASLVTVVDKERIQTVKYSNFKVLKNNANGEKKSKAINLDKFEQGAKWSGLSDTIDLEYYGIVWSKDTKNYIYRYWYDNDAGDKQPVVLNVTFDTDNKYLYYSSTLIYPEYL